jgi:hypothetical protein
VAAHRPPHHPQRLRGEARHFEEVLLIKGVRSAAASLSIVSYRLISYMRIFI